MVGAFAALQSGLARERTAMERLWRECDKQMERVIGEAAASRRVWLHPADTLRLHLPNTILPVEVLDRIVVRWPASRDNIISLYDETARSP